MSDANVIACTKDHVKCPYRLFSKLPVAPWLFNLILLTVTGSDWEENSSLWPHGTIQLILKEQGIFFSKYNFLMFWQ